MVIDRDFQIIELQGQVQQLQGQVHAPQTTVAEHEAMMEFLDEQIGELNMEIDNVQEQLQLQQMQQDALHAPPDVMDVDEEEPEEIECYSNVDFEGRPTAGTVGSSLSSCQRVVGQQPRRLLDLGSC